MKSPHRSTNSRRSSSSSSSSRSWAPSRSRSRARAAARSCSATALALGASLLLVFAATLRGGAQQIVPIPPPILGAPPLPSTPVGRSLAGAYGAIVAAGARDPFAAQQANFAYARALQQARVGNVAGALASAAEARAEAISGAPIGLVPAIAPIAPRPPAVPPVTGFPIVGNGVVLSPDLENARDEIALATRANGRNLTDARAHYRRALDAYVSGDASTSRLEARAAFDAAASGVSAKP